MSVGDGIATTVGERPTSLGRLDNYFRCEMALYVCICEFVYMFMYLSRFTPRRQPVRYFRHDHLLGRFSTRIFKVMVLYVYSAIRQVR